MLTLLLCVGTTSSSALAQIPINKIIYKFQLPQIDVESFLTFLRYCPGAYGIETANVMMIREARGARSTRMIFGRHL